MSYILDALKRSDQDRQKGGVPDLQTQPEFPTRPVSSDRRYLRYFGVLLALVLIVLLIAFYGFSDAEQPEAKTVSPSVTVNVPEAQAPVEQNKTPSQPKTNALDALKGIQLDTAPVADAVAQTKQSVQTPSAAENRVVVEQKVPTDVATPAKTTASNVFAVNSKPAPTSPATSAEVDYYDGIPHQRQLSASLQNELPDLNISVHIYAEQPGSRMVRINNTTYRQGDRIEKNLVLETITPDGVIMSIRDNRFWRRTR
ncbi:general secretion pathway protein GspB [Neptuniibacter sp. CAU 1671]|uniref:general secretion pathway protein GspB n=1 Tax=Neptuniibacter sp. CAU 1671 TaxID=3032593 RepID=UPI0023D9A366|nr:general secretion pathway protein GspB [Neptuniibacter sp. CAU 1671]MDF2180616.1 general secretion pathway protein GspB [Neptuniibacter sp. CAU 1671]